MKKLLSIFAILSATYCALALNFVTIPSSPTKATLSKTEWTDSTTNNLVKLKGKPTRNDSITFRYSGGDFLIDTNLDARSIGFYEEAFVVAENKKINSLRGGLTFVISSNPSHTNQLFLKNSEMNVNGSVGHSPTSGNKKIGMNVIKLENSKFFASGNMDFTITSSIFEPTRGRSGVKLIVIGDSVLKLKGSLLVDSILAENKNLLFDLVFENQKAKIGKIIVDKATIGGTDVRVNLKSPEKGRYTLLESVARKPLEGTPRGIFINDTQTSLDSPVTVDGLKCTVSIDSADSKDKNKNDIILTVE